MINLKESVFHLVFNPGLILHFIKGINDAQSVGKINLD